MWQCYLLLVRSPQQILEKYSDATIALMFGWQFMITYTIARTLSSKYHYDAWKIGFTSLGYGIGEF